MKALKKWWKKFKGPTPKKWARISKSFFSLSASVGGGWAAITTAGISLPEGVGKYIGIAIGVSAAIATFAQSQSVPETPDAE